MDRKRKAGRREGQERAAGTGVKWKSPSDEPRWLPEPGGHVGGSEWVVAGVKMVWNSVWLTVVLEKTLESPLDCKEIQPVHPKDQSWVFIGRTDVEAETPILWPPDAKNRLI